MCGLPINVDKDLAKKNFDIKDSLHFTGDLCCLKQKVGLETDTFDLSDQLDGIRGCISCD